MNGVPASASRGTPPPGLFAQSPRTRDFRSGLRVQFVCQWVEGLVPGFLYSFNCMELEVINRQPAGGVDVILNVGFGGRPGVEGA
jgi:hypothetical protein